MPIEVGQVFHAETKTVLELLGQPGKFFYIPPYQREYSWDRPKIDRLASDVLDGLRGTAENANSLTFIGAAIVVHDTHGQLVHPSVQPELPASIFVIIDGQQRCTTLVLWSVVLVSAIRERMIRLQSAGVGGIEPLVAKARQVEAELSRTIHEDQFGPVSEYAWYPRIIRSPDDQWSKKRTEAVYESPVASCLYQASAWLRAEAGGKFAFALPSVAEAELAKYQVVASGLATLRNITENYVKGKYPAELGGEAGGSALQVMSSPSLQELVFGARLGEDASRALSAAIQDEAVGAGKHVAVLLRLVALAHYLMRRVAVTHIAAKAESYAFDMFDSLNTTGEPLTAYETFRPMVIRAVGLAEYKHSSHSALVRDIDMRLPASGPEKEKGTAQFLIHCALSENGFRLSRKRSKQREWIQAAWSVAAGESDRGLGFLRGMQAVALTSKMFEAPSEAVEFVPGQQERLALEYLAKTKHDIAVPLVAMFRSAVEAVSPGPDREKAMGELRRLLRACLAFSVIWRSAKGGTAGIDDAYRTLLRGDGQGGIAKRCRIGRAAGDSAAAFESVSRDLKRLLSEADLDDRDKWVANVCDQPLGQTQIEVAKLLLGAGSDDVVPSDSSVGMVKPALRGTCPQLRADAQWWADSYELEHVAPRKRRSGDDWDDELYSADSRVHVLGNLTILPKWVNAQLGNTGWAKKRLIYKMLAAKSPEALVSLRSEGLELEQIVGSQRAVDEIVAAGRHLPSAQALGDVDTWSYEFVKCRGRNIAEVAHGRLFEWLG